MADDHPSHSDTTASTTDDEPIQTTVSATYKVLGQFAAASGAGVLGENIAGSGTPIGVEGAVPNASGGYGLSTPDDARVVGTAELGGLAGSLTGGTEVTDLTGTNVAISGGALTATDTRISVSDSGSQVLAAPDDVDFGSNLSVTNDGDNTVTVDAVDTDTDTRTDVSDGGTTVVTDTADINFASNLAVTDDGDGTVTVDATSTSKWAEADSDGLLEISTSETGIDVTTVQVSTVQATSGTPLTLDTRESDFVVEAGTTATTDATNVVMGHASNTATSGVVGATVGGGGSDDGSNDERNRVRGDFGTVSGGRDNEVTSGNGVVGGGFHNTTSGTNGTVGGGVLNTAGASATVAGGYNNSASGDVTTIAGGQANVASDSHATVLGGENNTASGKHSLAAGQAADTNGYDGAMVFGDGTTTAATATGPDEFRVQHSPVVLENGPLDLAGNDVTNVGSLDNGGSPVTVGDSLDLTGNVLTDTSGSLGVDTAESDLVVETGTTSTGDASNVVMGHASNTTGGVVVGATIGGGGFDDGSTDFKNSVDANYGTVAGGAGNTAGDSYSTVGGGRENSAIRNTGATVAGGAWNEASGRLSTVSGGTSNAATGAKATVPGGQENTASGDYSLAAGRQAATSGYDGAMVFGDSTANYVYAQGADEARFQHDLYANSLNNSSARSKKTDVAPVEAGEVLAGVRSLAVSTWRFRDRDDDARHMGPMAGDFHDAFGLGSDDGHIATVDADGVALAAIQALAQRLDDAREELAERDDRIEALERETGRIDDLEAENEQLRERLVALEARVGTDAGPADD